MVPYRNYFSEPAHNDRIWLHCEESGIGNMDTRCPAEVAADSSFAAGAAAVTHMIATVDTEARVETAQRPVQGAAGNKTGN